MKGIYLIKNLESGNGYVGSSSNIRKRWKEHVTNLNKGTHVNNYLQHAWNKYGKKAFEFSVLELVDDDLQIIPREQHYIDIHGSYNLQPAGKFGEFPQHGEYNHMYGKTWTDEQKQQKSEEVKGENNPFFGKTHSEEVRKKLREAREKQVFSEEAKEKHRESLKKATMSPERRKQLSEAGKKGNKSPKRDPKVSAKNLEARQKRVDAMTTEERKATTKAANEAVRGKKLSEERKKQMSEHMKKVWAERRAKKGTD